mgnify:CR=1 FL=1
MNIIILGAGRVGESVADSLVSERNDITVIDMATMTPLQSLPVGRTPHSIRVDD